MKKIVITSLLCMILVGNLYSEMWVGRAAPYQLPEGTITKSGEGYASNELRAACNGFRLGAEVKVVNTETGKSIKVVINDRIDSGSNYFILLTPKAAKELEIDNDSGLVIVDAKFTDVNSTERLLVNGLIPEGEVDVENLKRFPDVEWPDDDQTITKVTTETDVNRYYPEIEEEQLTPLLRHVETMMDTDVDLKKEKDDDIDEKDGEPPIKDTRISPEKHALVVEKIDMDEGRFNVFEDDKKVVTLTPLREEKRETPDKITQPYVIDEDIDGTLIPNIDTMVVLFPEKEKDKIDEDIDEKVTPEKDVVSIPLKDMQEAIIDFDKDSYTPFIEDQITLRDPDRSESTDEIDPDTLTALIDVKEKESDIIEPPIKEQKDTGTFYDRFRAYKRIEKVEIDNDGENDQKDDIQPVTWMTGLEKGSVYIRISTCFNEKEGERRYLLFNQLFKKIVGIEDKNKYIIYIGPLLSNEVTGTLNKVRTFGFKDAYIIKE